MFPLCARCAGMYLGVFFTFVVLTGARLHTVRIDPFLVLAVGLMGLPWCVDSWGNFLGLWSSEGWVRALTGALAGGAAALLVLPLTLQITAPAPAAAQLKAVHLAIVPAIAALVTLLLETNLAVMLQILVLPAAAGLAVLIACAVRLLFSPLVQRRRRYGAV